MPTQASRRTSRLPPGLPILQIIGLQVRAKHQNHRPPLPAEKPRDRFAPIHRNQRPKMVFEGTTSHVCRPRKLEGKQDIPFFFLILIPNQNFQECCVRVSSSVKFLFDKTGLPCRDSAVSVNSIKHLSFFFYKPQLDFVQLTNSNCPESAHLRG